MKKTVRRKSRSLAALSLVSAVSVPSSILMPTGDVWNDHNTFDDINCIIKKINDDWDYVNSDYRNTYIIGFQYR